MTMQRINRILSFILLLVLALPPLSVAQALPGGLDGSGVAASGSRCPMDAGTTALSMADGMPMPCCVLDDYETCSGEDNCHDNVPARTLAPAALPSLPFFAGVHAPLRISRGSDLASSRNLPPELQPPIRPR